MDDMQERAAARQRAETKLGFYKHLAVFVVILIGLTLINIFTGLEYFWAIWPMLGWGVAVVIHAFKVFAAPSPQELLDRMTEQELDKGR